MAKDEPVEPAEIDPGIDPTGNPTNLDPKRDRMRNAETDRGQVDNRAREDVVIGNEAPPKVERATRAPGETR